MFRGIWGALSFPFLIPKIAGTCWVKLLACVGSRHGRQTQGYWVWLQCQTSGYFDIRFDMSALPKSIGSF